MREPHQLEYMNENRVYNSQIQANDYAWSSEESTRPEIEVQKAAHVHKSLYTINTSCITGSKDLIFVLLFTYFNGL